MASFQGTRSRSTILCLAEAPIKRSALSTTTTTTTTASRRKGARCKAPTALIKASDFRPVASAWRGDRFRSLAGGRESSAWLKWNGNRIHRRRMRSMFLESSLEYIFIFEATRDPKQREIRINIYILSMFASRLRCSVDIYLYYFEWLYYNDKVAQWRFCFGCKVKWNCMYLYVYAAKLGDF